MSKYKNPINGVGVTVLYGIDEPNVFETEDLRFIKEHELTPKDMIAELKGFERGFFKAVFAGSFIGCMSLVCRESVFCDDK